MKQMFKSIVRFAWRCFRKLPLILQFMIGASCLGATFMGLFVGNLGLAFMGTAIGLSGVVIGFVLGPVMIIVSWALAIIFREKIRRAAE